MSDYDGHNVLIVKSRRWCLHCDLFQFTKDGGLTWLPRSYGECRRDTPLARMTDGKEEVRCDH